MEGLEGRAELAVVLGSGIGALAGFFDIEREIPYHALRGMRAPTVDGHSGRLLLARSGSSGILLFSGRLHCYEGLSLEEAGMPARIASELGCRRLLLTQASGGLRGDLEVGSWLLATDIVTLPRRPDPGEPGSGIAPVPGRLISESFRLEIIDVALRKSIRLRQGILFWTTGPCYETRAESLAAVEMGASVASMSGVPELVTARRVGMEAAVLSLVTNHAPSVSGEGVKHGAILAEGERGVLALNDIVAGLLSGSEDR